MIRATIRRAVPLIAFAVTVGRAQDSTAGPVVSHALLIDSARVASIHRVYDMRVTVHDSTISVGERVVTLSAATYNGDSAWLVTETRSGLVPSMDSLYLSRALRPLHWTAVAGLAHFGAEFVGDSIYGATTGPTGRQNIVLAARSDLIASGAVLEALLTALPLDTGFRDSISVLDVSLASSTWHPGELAVVGEDSVADADSTPRACWLVALRVENRQALYWVDKATGATLRMEQQLPSGVGQLDYILKPDPSVIAP